jgi:hypothetical protein
VSERVGEVLRKLYNRQVDLPLYKDDHSGEFVIARQFGAGLFDALAAE